MANVAISQLPSTSASDPTDVFPIVQNGITKKISNADLFSTTALTNATGLPIVAGTTGTLSVARGGTGVTTATGTGDLVLANGPTLIAPSLGVASATSINKITLTAASSGATLTIADGKTLRADNTLTLAGTDGKTMTFPSTDATIARTDAAQTFTGLQTITTGLVGGVQSLSGPGAVNLTTFATAYTSTGGSGASPQALTLADGVVGQIKVIAYVAQAAGTDAGRLTPTSCVNYSYINFNSLNHTIILMYFTQGWAVIGGNGAVVV